MWGRYSSGQWYPARVSEVLEDGRYVLDWDDGDPQDRVKGPEEVPPFLPNPEVGVMTWRRRSLAYFKINLLALTDQLVLQERGSCSLNRSPSSTVLFFVTWSHRAPAC